MPVVLDGGLRPNPDGSYALTLEAADVPQSLDLYGIDLNLWGVPWGASHDDERGSCLNEAEPIFGWCKASPGEPGAYVPKAYLTLPSACSGPLYLTATADSWQQPSQVSTSAINRTSGGAEAPMSCKGLVFAPHPEGLLNDTKASSPSGYAFRLNEDLEAFTEPGQFVHPQVKQAVVHLPARVSVNPSVGAGLATCSPGQYAAESVYSRQGDNCPNASKLGDFEVVARSSKADSKARCIWLRPTTTPFTRWSLSTSSRGFPTEA